MVTRCLLVALCLLIERRVQAETVAELLQQVKSALSQGDIKKALALADRAVAQDDQNAPAYHLRGSIRERLGLHKEAIADFDKTIALDPKNAEAYDQRGSERFKLGQIKESITDFDRYLEFHPEAVPGHWKRGISYYYVGRYEDGRKQFEGYEKVDTNDVENAVWRYLCMARSEGVDKARASILKIGNDRRVPMMEVYRLFRGQSQPEDVLKAAQTGKPTEKELHTRLFYAHLYLGLYFEAAGDRKRTLEHMTKAAEEHPIGHYMWDVARVHLGLLKGQK